MESHGYTPFIWPKAVPRNKELVVATVADEEELNKTLPKSLTEKPYSVVGTHSGVFHADEVMACVLLKYAKMLTAPGLIIRSRNDNLLQKLKIVIDVGGKFDPKEIRYDHHMKEFKGIYLKK